MRVPPIAERLSTRGSANELNHRDELLEQELAAPGEFGIEFPGPFPVDLARLRQGRDDRDQPLLGKTPRRRPGEIELAEQVRKVLGPDVVGIFGLPDRE